MNYKNCYKEIFLKFKNTSDVVFFFISYFIPSSHPWIFFVEDRLNHTREIEPKKLGKT